MVAFFKNKARAKALRSAQQKLKRTMRFSSFEGIKTAGIICYFNLNGENAAVAKLVNVLEQKGIKTQILAYYPEKKLPAHATVPTDRLLLTDKDTNWLGLPIKKEVEDFINMNLDLLIDFVPKRNYTIQYIVQASRAAFKVGNISYTNDPYDFVLTGDSHNPQYVDDLLNYLSKLK